MFIVNVSARLLVKTNSPATLSRARGLIEPYDPKVCYRGLIYASDTSMKIALVLIARRDIDLNRNYIAIKLSG